MPSCDISTLLLLGMVMVLRVAAICDKVALEICVESFHNIMNPGQYPFTREVRVSKQE